MSNRSYNSNPMTVGLEPKSSFNSPWECRIGLTLVEFVEADEPDMYFQFPVGMSNRSYVESLWTCYCAFRFRLSIPRGNVE